MRGTVSLDNPAPPHPPAFANASAGDLAPKGRGKRNWRLLALLMAMTAIGPATLNILVPALPGLITRLATDTGTVQLTLSLYLLSLATAQLLLGPLSDRFGRRPVVLAGLALNVAGLARRHRRLLDRRADRRRASCRRSAPRPAS